MAENTPKKVPTAAGKVVILICVAATVATVLVLNRTTEGAVPGGAIGGGIAGGVGALIGIVIVNVLGLNEVKE